MIKSRILRLALVGVAMTAMAACARKPVEGAVPNEPATSAPTGPAYPTAPTGPIAPDSPTPFSPSGLRVEGVSRCAITNEGTSSARAITRSTSRSNASLGSPVPGDLPRTAGKQAEMLPEQRTLGGGKDQTPLGPGVYSFNWWVNRDGKDGKRLFADLPADAYVASGHGGKRALWVVPSLDLIVAWNDAKIDDHNAALANPMAKCNQAARLIREAAGR